MIIYSTVSSEKDLELKSAIQSVIPTDMIRAYGNRDELKQNLLRLPVKDLVLLFFASSQEEINLLISLNSFTRSMKKIVVFDEYSDEKASSCCKSFPVYMTEKSQGYRDVKMVLKHLASRHAYI